MCHYKYRKICGVEKLFKNTKVFKSPNKFGNKNKAGSQK